jgi:hypothetical protein
MFGWCIGGLLEPRALSMLTLGEYPLATALHASSEPPVSHTHLDTFLPADMLRMAAE